MRPLEVSAQLTLAMDGHELLVQAERKQITVELQHGRTALQLWRQGGHRSFLARVRDALFDADLTVCIGRKI